MGLYSTGLQSTLGANYFSRTTLGHVSHHLANLTILSHWEVVPILPHHQEWCFNRRIPGSSFFLSLAQM